MTIKKLALSLVMCGLIGMPIAFAKGEGKPLGLGGKKSAELFDKLNLTPEQRKSLESSKDAQMEQIKGLLNEMMGVNSELNEELMKSKLDMNKINDLNVKLKAVQGRMADKRINTILDVRKTLTPDQFNEFIKLTDEMRTKRRERHGDDMFKKK